MRLVSPSAISNSPLAMQHHRQEADASDQVARDERASDRANRAAESDDGEEAFPLVGRVEVVRERPELGDDHQVEDAHPQEKRHRDECRRQAELTDESKKATSVTTKNIVTELINRMRSTLLASAL